MKEALSGENYTVHSSHSKQTAVILISVVTGVGAT